MRDELPIRIETPLPQIFYASRTHTQLRQLTSELIKTTFAKTALPGDDDPSDKDTAPQLPVRMVPLGGRKQLCVNDRVRAIGARSGDERMNEACLDLQKGGLARRRWSLALTMLVRRQEGPMRVPPARRGKGPDDRLS